MKLVIFDLDQTIAVATGFHSPRQLSDRRPDYLFESLKDYKKVLRAIG